MISTKLLVCELVMVKDEEEKGKKREEGNIYVRGGMWTNTWE